MTTQRKYNRFRKGSGVFTCRVCDYKTRDIGEDNTEVRLCFECYELAVMEIRVQNGEPLTEAQRKQVERYFDIMEKRGTDPAINKRWILGMPV